MDSRERQRELDRGMTPEAIRRSEEMERGLENPLGGKILGPEIAHDEEILYTHSMRVAKRVRANIRRAGGTSRIVRYARGREHAVIYKEVQDG